MTDAAARTPSSIGTAPAAHKTSHKPHKTPGGSGMHPELPQPPVGAPQGNPGLCHGEEQGCDSDVGARGAAGGRDGADSNGGWPGLMGVGSTHKSTDGQVSVRCGQSPWTLSAGPIKEAKWSKHAEQFRKHPKRPWRCLHLEVSLQNTRLPSRCGQRGCCPVLPGVTLAIPCHPVPARGPPPCGDMQGSAHGTRCSLRRRAGSGPLIPVAPFCANEPPAPSPEGRAVRPLGFPPRPTVSWRNECRALSSFKGPALTVPVTSRVTRE